MNCTTNRRVQVRPPAATRQRAGGGRRTRQGRRAGRAWHGICRLGPFRRVRAFYCASGRLILCELRTTFVLLHFFCFEIVSFLLLVYRFVVVAKVKTIFKRNTKLFYTLFKCNKSCNSYVQIQINKLATLIKCFTYHYRNDLRVSLLNEIDQFSRKKYRA